MTMNISEDHLWLPLTYTSKMDCKLLFINSSSSPTRRTKIAKISFLESRCSSGGLNGGIRRDTVSESLKLTTEGRFVTVVMRQTSFFFLNFHLTWLTSIR